MLVEYLRLGQPATTLSGGEAQVLKPRELVNVASGTLTSLMNQPQAFIYTKLESL